MLNVEDTEGGFVRGGIEGRVVEVGEGVPPLRPALRFCVLFVLARPKPWRLKDDMMISGASLAGRGRRRSCTYTLWKKVVILSGAECDRGAPAETSS